MTVNVLLALVFVLSVWLVVGLLLRERSPRWYWYLVGYPACWWRMRWHWRALVMQCGLHGQVLGGSRLLLGRYAVEAQAARPPVPKLWIGGPRHDGLLARVVLLPGQTPAEYVKTAIAMAHTWRVHAVRVSSPARGFVQLRVYHSDPIPGVVVRDPRAVVAPTSPTARPTRDMALRASVGVREDGREWILDFRRVAHWLIMGVTQSGKSTLLRALFVALAPLPVGIVVLDLKGGMEFNPFIRRLSGLATDLNDAITVLGEVMAVAQERKVACRTAGVQSVWNLPEVPAPLVVIVDEIAELYLHGDASHKALRERGSSTLLRLAQIGAALGIHLVVCGQRVGSELGPGVTALRAQTEGRICHRVADRQTAEMALGDVAGDAVETALMLTAAHQGFAVTTDPEGHGGWLRARGVLTSVQTAATAAVTCAVMAPDIPGITRPRPGGESGDQA